MKTSRLMRHWCETSKMPAVASSGAGGLTASRWRTGYQVILHYIVRACIKKN